MTEKIDIMKLTPDQHQALVCMFFAMLPKTDSRYKKRNAYWEVLQRRFNKKVSTYKFAKDTFDRYFPGNNRAGWSDERALERRGKEFQVVYDMFKDYDVAVIESAVEDIIELYKNEEFSVVSMKCGFPETVHKMLAGEKEITIDGVYTLQEELTLDKIVFVTLGGDTGKAEVDLLCVWDETIDDTKPLEIFDPHHTWKRKTLENFTAEELLQPIFKNGEQVYTLPTLAQIRQHCADEIAGMWDEVRRFSNPHNYYVDLSQKLWDIKHNMLRAKGVYTDGDEN